MSSRIPPDGESNSYYTPSSNNNSSLRVIDKALIIIDLVNQKYLSRALDKTLKVVEHIKVIGVDAVNSLRQRDPNNGSQDQDD